MKKGLLVLMLLSSMSSAIAPQVYEHKNLGNILLPEMLYSLSVDCENATVDLIVMDTNFSRVENSSTFLKYVDFDTMLLSRETTGRNGTVIHQLPGNVSNMRGLFILVLEKKGYRSKEIHFDILRCFGKQEYPPIPAKPVRNVTVPVVELKENKTAPPEVEENISQNATNVTTEQTTPMEEGQAQCLAAILVSALLVAFMKVRG